MTAEERRVLSRRDFARMAATGLGAFALADVLVRVFRVGGNEALADCCSCDPSCDAGCDICDQCQNCNAVCEDPCETSEMCDGYCDTCDACNVCDACNGCDNCDACNAD
jgi:hypothetical protein